MNSTSDYSWVYQEPVDITVVIKTDIVTVLRAYRVDAPEVVILCLESCDCTEPRISVNGEDYVAAKDYPEITGLFATVEKAGTRQVHLDGGRPVEEREAQIIDIQKLLRGRPW